MQCLFADELENKLKKLGLNIIRDLGVDCIFDEELNAEICFRFIKDEKYDKDVVNYVKVRTTFLEKDKFIEFLKKIKEKYEIPNSVRIHVIPVSKDVLEDAKWFYKRGV